MRQLLVYLSAALIAGGAGSHEVERDIRVIATRLGHPGVQLHAQPVGVALSLVIWLIFSGLLNLSLPGGPLEHLFL